MVAGRIRPESPTDPFPAFSGSDKTQSPHSLSEGGGNPVDSLRATLED